MPKSVLIVEDDRAMCDLLRDDLADRSFEVATRSSAADALALLSERSFDVVLTDLNLGGMTGIELGRRIAESRPDVPVIVITAFGSIETAVLAIRSGAYDYITKPIDVEALVLVLDRAITHYALREEVRRLRRVVDESSRFEDLAGPSPAMREVWARLARVADSDASVLITGESGTGKEVVAKALHARGKRRSGPFVAVNCAAVPEALLESELFGHAKGAFTDAKTARTGLFAQADGGTIFLDEIGELPLGMQPKLLRALQERSVRPVGGTTEIPFDARIVAATNRDLESAVEERTFREDLYYRINVIHVELPPLRARGGDVLLLAQRFIDDLATSAGKRVTGISAPAAEKLLAYAWPGNVRELRNCIEHAVALTVYEQITADDLPARVKDHRPSHVLVASEDPTELAPLEEVERRYVLRVLDSAGGNKTLAARILGLDRKTLHRKLERWSGRSI